MKIAVALSYLTEPYSGCANDVGIGTSLKLAQSN